MKMYRIQFSNISSSEQLVLRRKGQELGAIFSKMNHTYELQTTHIIVGEFVISEKTVAAMAAGKWILHKNFIYKSFTVGYWLPETYFEISCEKSNFYGSSNKELNRKELSKREKILNAPRRCRELVLVRGRPMCANWNVGILMCDQNERYKLIRILEAGGAIITVLNQAVLEFWDSASSDIEFVFVDKTYKEFKHIGLPFISPQYLFTYLLQDHPLPMEFFRYSQANNHSRNSRYCLPSFATTSGTTNNRDESSKYVGSCYRRPFVPRRGLSEKPLALGYHHNKIPLHIGRIRQQRSWSGNSSAYRGNILQPSTGVNTYMNDTFSSVCSSEHVLRKNTISLSNVATSVQNKTCNSYQNNSFQVRKEDDYNRNDENVNRYQQLHLCSHTSDKTAHEMAVCDQLLTKDWSCSSYRCQPSNELNNAWSKELNSAWPKSQPSKELNSAWPKSEPSKELNSVWPKSEPSKELNSAWPKSEPSKELNSAWPKSQPSKELNSAWPKSEPSKKFKNSWSQSITRTNRQDSTLSSNNLTGIAALTDGFSHVSANDRTSTTSKRKWYSEDALLCKKELQSSPSKPRQRRQYKKNFPSQSNKIDRYLVSLPPPSDNVICVEDADKLSFSRTNKSNSEAKCCSVRCEEDVIVIDDKVEEVRMREGNKDKRILLDQAHDFREEIIDLSSDTDQRTTIYWKNAKNSDTIDLLPASPISIINISDSEEDHVTDDSEIEDTCEVHSDDSQDSDVKVVSSSKTLYLNKNHPNSVIDLTSEYIISSCDNRENDVHDSEVGIKPNKEIPFDSWMKEKRKLGDDGNISIIRLSPGKELVSNSPDSIQKPCTIVVDVNSSNGPNNVSPGITDTSKHSKEVIDITESPGSCNKNSTYGEQKCPSRESTRSENFSCEHTNEKSPCSKYEIIGSPNVKSVRENDMEPHIISYECVILSGSDNDSLHGSLNEKSVLKNDTEPHVSSCECVTLSESDNGSVDGSPNKTSMFKNDIEPHVNDNHLQPSVNVVNPIKTVNIDNTFGDPMVKSSNIEESEHHDIHEKKSTDNIFYQTDDSFDDTNNNANLSIMENCCAFDNDITLDETFANEMSINEQSDGNRVYQSVSSDKTAKESVKTDILINSYKNVMDKHHDNSAARLEMSYIAGCCKDPYMCKHDHKNKECELVEVCGTMGCMLGYLMEDEHWSDAFNLCDDMITSMRKHPSSRAVLCLFNFILNTHSEDLIDSAISVFKKMVNHFPPCDPCMEPFYKSVLTDTLGKDSLISGKGTLLDIVSRINTMLLPANTDDENEDLVSHDTYFHENVTRGVHSKYEKVYRRFAVVEAVEASKNYHTLEHDVQLDRLFLVLELLVELFETDLSVFLVKHGSGWKQTLTRQSCKPLIVSALWISSTFDGIGRINNNCCSVIDMHVRCFRKKIPVSKRDISTRLLALIAEVARGTENNDLLRYPYFAENMEDLSLRVSQSLEDLDADDLVNVLAEMKPSYLSLFVTNRVLCKVTNTPITYPSLKALSCILSKSLHSKGGNKKMHNLNEIGNTETTKATVLGKKGVNKRNAKGEARIHIVCRNNKVEELEHLLEEPDIDINITDNFGWTALHEAAHYSSLNCLYRLLEHKPPSGRPGLNLRAKSEDGITPLMDAAREGHVEVCKLLLEYGGAVLLDDKNCKGESAVDITQFTEIQNVLHAFKEAHIAAHSPCQKEVDDEEEEFECDADSISPHVLSLLSVTLHAYMDTYQTPAVIHKIKSCVTKCENTSTKRKGRPNLRYDYAQFKKDYNSMKKIKQIIKKGKSKNKLLQSLLLSL